MDIEAQSLVSTDQLKITIPSSGERFGMSLKKGQSTILGRSNLGSNAASVSSQHLEIISMGRRVFLRHIGRYPTAVLRDGQWYNLRETWVEVEELSTAPITLRLADLHIDIGI